MVHVDIDFLRVLSLSQGRGQRGQGLLGWQPRMIARACVQQVNGRVLIIIEMYEK